LLQRCTVFALVLVACAAIASPAFGKRTHRRHHHPPRRLAAHQTHPTAQQAVLPAQQAQFFPTGWGELDVSGPVVRLSGNPLDNVNNVFSVASPGIVLNLSSATIYASAALCAQRQQQCGADPMSGPAWFTVPASFLRSQDVVIVQLGVRDTLATNMGSSVPIPVAWLYDVY
jgi:hypothetical protein